MLLTKGVVMTDATTVTVDGKQDYIRNFNSAEAAVYFSMDSKTIKKMKEIPFLGRGRDQIRGSANGSFILIPCYWLLCVQLFKLRFCTCSSPHKF